MPVKEERSLVSVVMCVYNGENFISEAIRSILEQTYNKLELIIIDDCSSDKTESIIKSYNDSRIRYIKNEVNKGIFYSANIGLRNSSGKYIARIDADDIAHKDRIREQVAFMEQHPDIGLCGTESVTFSGSKKYSKTLLPRHHEEILAYFMFGNCIVHPSIMIRKSVLNEHQVEYDEMCVAGGDFALYMSLWDKTKFANIDKPLLYYRLHAKNVTKLKKKEQKDVTNNRRLEYIKKIFEASVSSRELEEKHLRMLKLNINGIEQFEDLSAWLTELAYTSNNLISPEAFMKGGAHYLYRKLLHGNALSVRLYLRFISNYKPLYLSLPWQYKMSLALKCLKRG